MHSFSSIGMLISGIGALFCIFMGEFHAWRFKRSMRKMKAAAERLKADTEYYWWEVKAMEEDLAKEALKPNDPYRTAAKPETCVYCENHQHEMDDEIRTLQKKVDALWKMMMTNVPVEPKTKEFQNLSDDDLEAYSEQLQKYLSQKSKPNRILRPAPAPVPSNGKKVWG